MSVPNCSSLKEEHQTFLNLLELIGGYLCFFSNFFFFFVCTVVTVLLSLPMLDMDVLGTGHTD